MKRLFLILLCVPLFWACGDSDDESNYLSKDAQVYSFKLIGENALENKTLADVKFTIDLIKCHIFNTTPIIIEKRLFKIDLTFSNNPPKEVFILYDERIDIWNKNIIIDFSKNPKINVIAADGISEKTYTIEIK